MKARETIPLNTLDRALQLARILSRDLAKSEGKAYRDYRIFSALTTNELEGLAAFLIWRARGEIISELTRGQ